MKKMKKTLLLLLIILLDATFRSFVSCFMFEDNLSNDLCAVPEEYFCDRLSSRSNDCTCSFIISSFVTTSLYVVGVFVMVGGLYFLFRDLS